MAPAMPCKTCKKNKHGETWDNIAGRGDNEFTTALQFGTQIYPYASSHEDTRSKSSSGSRMRETSKDSLTERNNSQKQIRGDR